MHEDFDWGELGAEWWTKTAADTGATEKHAKFAAAKHRGATNTDAARGAGFGGGSEASVRSEGYRLARSNKIMQLLALATAEAGGGYDGTLSSAEAKQILTTLARGSDPAIRIKSIEALNKLEEQNRAKFSDDYERGDGLLDWRVERDFLLMPNGAVAYVLTRGLMGDVGNLHLLHDTYALLMQQQFGPELWEQCRARLNDDALAHLDRCLIDPNYQIDVRKQIWGEVGIDITKVDKVQYSPPTNGSRLNGEAVHAP